MLKVEAKQRTSNLSCWDTSITTLILPTCHGKTTVHNEGAGIYDIGTMVPNDPVVKERRAAARSTGDWAMFDNFLLERLEYKLPGNCRVLLLNHPGQALRFGLTVKATLVLELALYQEIVLNRGRPSLEVALQDRQSVVESSDEVTFFNDIGDLIKYIKDSGRKCTNTNQ